MFVISHSAALVASSAQAELCFSPLRPWNIWAKSTQENYKSEMFCKLQLRLRRSVIAFVSYIVIFFLCQQTDYLAKSYLLLNIHYVAVYFVSRFYIYNSIKMCKFHKKKIQIIYKCKQKLHLISNRYLCYNVVKNVITAGFNPLSHIYTYQMCHCVHWTLPLWLWIESICSQNQRSVLIQLYQHEQKDSV